MASKQAEFQEGAESSANRESHFTRPPFVIDTLWRLTAYEATKCN